MNTGPVLILGCPGSGKTTLGESLAYDLIDVTGAALIVADTGRVEAFDKMYHAASLAELARRVWGEGFHTAYTPEDPEDFNQLCKMIVDAAEANRARGLQVVPVILFLDELFNIKPGREVPKWFSKCLREWRRILAGAFVTSQLYRDSGRVLKGLVSRIIVHRMTAPEDQTDLRADYGLEPEVISVLPSAKECYDAGRPVSDAYKDLKVGF